MKVITTSLLVFLLLLPQLTLAATDTKKQVVICQRVAKRFKGDQKKIENVNKRLQKRFGFACESGMPQLTPAASNVDLSVTLDSGPSEMPLGGQGYYYFTVTNNSTERAMHVVMEHMLPKGLRVLVTDTSGECFSGPPMNWKPQSGPLIVCTISTLAGGESKEILLSINYSDSRVAPYTAELRATVSSDEIDDNMGNNTSSALEVKLTP